MAFPTIGTTSGADYRTAAITESTNHDFLTPTGTTLGQLLIYFLAYDAQPTWTTSPTAAGWTECAFTGVFNYGYGIYYKYATATEVGGNTVTARFSSAESGSYICVRVNGAHASTPPEFSVVTSGTSTSPDPASLDPSAWAAEDTLWLAMAAWANGATTASAYPAGYTNNQLQQAAGSGSEGVGLGIASRALNATSADPGAFTISASRAWYAHTIAIRPAADTGLAGTTRQILYNVYNRASATRQILYDVTTPIVTAGKSAQIRYDVYAHAGAMRMILYDVSDPNLPAQASTAIPTPARLTEAQAERAMLNGHLGQIEYRYRIYKSNNLSERIQEITAVEEASFSIDNMRDHTWELNLPMDVVDYFDIWGDWVRLEVEMSTAGGIGGEGYTINRPFGLYFFDQRAGEDAPERRKWELGGKSAEARLMGSTAEAGYSIAAGQPILAAVRNILLARGVPASMIVFPPSTEDVAMGTTTYFDPFNNATDTRWLRICNTILAAGGFLAIFADNSGRLTTRKINPSNRIEPAHTYGTTADSDKMIVSNIPYTYDDENFANRVVVYSGDPSEAASFGVAENHDPNSRVSYERLGYWVQPDHAVIELPSLVSPAEAQMVALQALRLKSGMSLRLSFDTVFDTRIKPRQAYGLEVFADDGEPIRSGDTWPVLNVSADLSLSPMSHEIQVGISL